jgi:NAD(P)H-hydrate repair Nnr-like enzyme with NAD(P)H-hydrate dehydratase domain
MSPVSATTVLIARNDSNWLAIASSVQGARRAGADSFTVYSVYPLAAIIDTAFVSLVSASLIRDAKDSPRVVLENDNARRPERMRRAPRSPPRVAMAGKPR